MSTQLILYPQNFKGRYNSTATPSFNEYIVNGINFIGLDAVTQYPTTDNFPSQAAIINSPPAILGNWYSYYTTGGPWAAVIPPFEGVGAAVLPFGGPTLGHCGIYQQLSGLAVGGMYDVVINIPIPVVGTLTIEFYTGTVLQNTQSFSSNVTQITTTFTAQSTNDIFLIDYSSTTGVVSISDISIQESPETVTNIYSDLYNGQVICDLYQEEDIPLTLSIDDFKNVAEQVKSYSKDFNLPATKRNNRIFNNMFEVTRADDRLIFNPYIKTQCVLKQDGFILFEGYLRLIDVKDKEGEISYNVNLYSDVVALADTLKDKTFAELDFTELEHEYNKTQIKRSWNDSPDASITYLNAGTSGFRDAYTTLRYPFIDWTGSVPITTNTSTVSGPTPNNPQLMSLEQAFRPCIQLKYLINKIFAASGFNWTSTFFDSADFGKLYMDFNWGADNSPVTFDSTRAQSTDVAQQAISTFTTLQVNTPWGASYTPEMGYSTGVFTASHDSQTYYMSYYFPFDSTGAPWSLTHRWKWVHASTGFVEYINETPLSDTTAAAFPWPSMSGNFTRTLMNGDTLNFEFQSVDSPSTGINTHPVAGSLVGDGLINCTTSVESITTSTILQTLRGELGQWDFLKGIMTMFNLVSMIDETDPDNILIEPYNESFLTNPNTKELDWTDKVDVSEMELNPLTDLNKNTIFKFVEDDDDYVFRQYKNSTSGHLYGSKKYDASGFTILEGEEEIIAEPFAATLSRPLFNQFSSFIVPNVYSGNDDGTYEGFDNSPRIFYNNGVKDTGASYYIPPQNGLSSENQTDFLQFSHLSDIPTIVSTPPAATDTRDFVFESSQLISSLGSPPTENLFSVYWQPYFNELYNADTRTMTLKVNLSPTDVANFKFYHTVFIKNRTFRVNKIDYKPNDLATVEFILIP
jgi:hypothetical protein